MIDQDPYLSDGVEVPGYWDYVEMQQRGEKPDPRAARFQQIRPGPPFGLGNACAGCGDEPRYGEWFCAPCLKDKPIRLRQPANPDDSEWADLPTLGKECYDVEFRYGIPVPRYPNAYEVRPQMDAWIAATLAIFLHEGGQRGVSRAVLGNDTELIPTPSFPNVVQAVDKLSERIEMAASWPSKCLDNPFGIEIICPTWAELQRSAGWQSYDRCARALLAGDKDAATEEAQPLIESMWTRRGDEGLLRKAVATLRPLVD